MIEVRDNMTTTKEAFGYTEVTTVEKFMQNEDCNVKVPLYHGTDKIGIGHLNFGMFKNPILKLPEVIDKEYPHVMKNCIVCKDTHKNRTGGQYKCIYCVCCKCNGNGINESKGPNVDCEYISVFNHKDVYLSKVKFEE